MKKRKVFVFILGLLLLITVSGLFTNSVYAQQPAVTDNLRVDFINYNNNTNWQVIWRLGWLNDSGRRIEGGSSTNYYTWSNAGVFLFNNRRPSSFDRYYVHWSTSCRDPYPEFVPGSCSYDGAWIQCSFNTLRPNVSYRVGSTPGNNLGPVLYNGNTGASFSYATCPQCRPGDTQSAFCGTGSNRCDRLRRTCNNNGQWVTTVVANNSSLCVGVDGCCLSNSNCSGGSYFCGSGGNRCDRRQNFCNSNKQCAVRTTNPSAPICNGENDCCQNDSHCGSNQYCHNPPDGECRTFAQVAGRVFVDKNTNNRWDSGTDEGLGGKTVQRRNASATTWAQTLTTGGSGYYNFDRKNNPSQHDVRITQSQYDTTCTYAAPDRWIWNNVTATPSLSNVNFIFDIRSWAIPGTVWRDANNNGVRDTGDVRVNNSNIKVRVNNANNGNFVTNDSLNSEGNFWLPGLVNGRAYIVTLATGTLPSGWSVIGSNQANVTINCANAPRVHFLVTNNPTIIPNPVPDLTITSFSIPSGYTGTSATGSITISNDGNAGTGVGFSININNGSGGSTTISTSSLAAGASRPLTFTITRPGTGNTYTATARVDSGSAIAESNENNNTATTQYDAVPRGVPIPDPIIDPGDPTDPSDDVVISGNPDLVVVPGTFTIPSGDVGTTSNGNIRVRNIGNESTGSGFSISIDADGTGANVRNIGAPALAAGAQSALLGFTINIPNNIGQHTAIATVDSTNLINESDEGNNDASADYNATYTPPTYSIQGGVFVDSVDALQRSDGIRNPATEPYVGGTRGTLSIPGHGNVSSAGFSFSDFLEGDYPISYNLSNLPTGWELVYPSPNNPFSNPSITFSPAEPPRCSVGSHNDAECDADGNITKANFAIRQKPAEPWFKGIGGDMRSDDPLDNRIPNAAGDYFSDRSANLPTGGVVFGKFNLTPFTEEAPRISYNRNWNVGNEFNGNLNFSYSSMQNILSKNGVWNTRTTLSCNQSSCTLPATLDGIYTSGALRLTGGNYVFPVGVDVVFMINGDLRIENNIRVPAGSTAIFIVNGAIIVNQNVTELHGIYSANGRFRAESAYSDSPDAVLQIEGSIIANAGGSTTMLDDAFVNKRNLYRGNETDPSLIIRYRPDFVLNAPAYIKFTNYSIKEVAPGSE